MNKNIIKIILIVNVCVLTSCTKMENENNIDTVNEEILVPQTNENNENVEVNTNYINDIKPNIRKKNESRSDIIPIKKDEFGENIVLEKYNYYFADSEIDLNNVNDVEYLIDVDIYFPQITMPNDKDLEAKINENLKVPLVMFGDDENERIAHFDNSRQVADKYTEDATFKSTISNFNTEV